MGIYYHRGKYCSCVWRYTTFNPRINEVRVKACCCHKILIMLGVLSQVQNDPCMP